MIAGEGGKSDRSDGETWSVTSFNVAVLRPTLTISPPAENDICSPT